MTDLQTLDEAGGARSAGYAKRLLSWWPGCSSRIPPTYIDLTEPPAAFFTTYSPPNPLALTDAECDDIIALGTAGEFTYDLSPIRSVSLKDPPKDLLTRVAATMFTANDAWWNLEITGVRLVILRYLTGDRFTEHQDMHPGQWLRKLSATIQLSDPDDYDGGDLMLRAWNDQGKAPRARGSVTVFPGWCPHEVTEVTRGVRWSLVAWGYGPPVR